MSVSKSHIQLTPESLSSNQILSAHSNAVHFTRTRVHLVTYQKHSSSQSGVFVVLHLRKHQLREHLTFHKSIPFCGLSTILCWTMTLLFRLKQSDILLISTQSSQKRMGYTSDPGLLSMFLPSTEFFSGHCALASAFLGLWGLGRVTVKHCDNC
jgi:hypothetical protein